MNKLLTLLLALTPVIAIAHPDHSHGTYSLAHYFTGSHLMLALAVVLVSIVGYRLAKRFYLR